MVQSIIANTKYLNITTGFENGGQDIKAMVQSRNSVNKIIVSK